MNCVQNLWPEPIVRVQSLSESGIQKIPDRYVKPDCHRASLEQNPLLEIPVIDFQHVLSTDSDVRAKTRTRIASACKDWGFLQVVNHGVDREVMRRTRQVWRGFFDLPLDVKQEYANAPTTYEGYGSRLGVEKGASLDWTDYFFLHYMPASLRDQAKWPSLPHSLRELTNEYGRELMKLGREVLKVLSMNLGVEETYLERAFGGEENIGGCLRVNFYPKCPQPHLTLGLSSHSDPGGMTILLPDDDVAGLQVRRGDSWLTVNPLPDAFIINIGDQIQVLSNAIYKSVEHRVIVNSIKDRVSLAFFYNPKGDIVIEPCKDLVNENQPALYPPMTFNEYRLHIRTKGLCGKEQVESLKSSKS